MLHNLAVQGKSWARSASKCYWERMFSGLVQAQGRVSERTARSNGLRLACQADLGAVEVGESIAVDGVCLTAVAIKPKNFEVDATAETLEKTTLARLRVGDAVNLERSLRLSDRLGGHWVTGHVDTTTEVIKLTTSPTGTAVAFHLPRHLSPFVAVKGSVAINGVSLTVNNVSDSRFEVMLIPHTRSVTNLGQLQPHSLVNLEVDTVARYVGRHLSCLLQSEITLRQVAGSEGGFKEARLQRALLRAKVLQGPHD